jgi:hypothetical protein
VSGEEKGTGTISESRPLEVDGTKRMKAEWAYEADDDFGTMVRSEWVGGGTPGWSGMKRGQAHLFNQWCLSPFLPLKLCLILLRLGSLHHQSQQERNENAPDPKGGPS